MIIMDRENYAKRGWSHVLSTTDDLTELNTFAAEVGAPRSAQQYGKTHSVPHLDLCRGPRDRALMSSNATVFESSLKMMRFYRDGKARAQLRQPR